MKIKYITPATFALLIVAVHPSTSASACGWECDPTTQSLRYCCGNACFIHGAACDSKAAKPAQTSKKKTMIDRNTLQGLCNGLQLHP